MISGRVRPPRDGLPGGNARLSWTLDKITWGRRGLPKCRRRQSGVWCGRKISMRRRARGCFRSCTCVQTGQAAPPMLLISARVFEAPGWAVRMGWLGRCDNPVEWPVGVSAGPSGGHHAWSHTGWAGYLRGWLLVGLTSRAAEAQRRDRQWGGSEEEWRPESAARSCDPLGWWSRLWGAVEQVVWGWLERLPAYRCWADEIPGSWESPGLAQWLSWNGERGTAEHWLEPGGSWLGASFSHREFGWCRAWKYSQRRPGARAPANYDAWRLVQSPTGHSCWPCNVQPWLPLTPWSIKYHVQL